MRKMMKSVAACVLCLMLLTGFAGVSFAAEAQQAIVATEQPGLLAPENLTVTSINKSGVVLQWNAVEGASKYKVYTSTGINGTYKLLKTLSATKLTHKIKLGDAPRYYCVAAVFGKKTGPLSAPLTVWLSGITDFNAEVLKNVQSGFASALENEYVKIVNQAYVIGGLEQKYLDALNADRAAHGLNPVKFRADLAKTAMLKAADMQIAGYFYADHRSPAYGSPSEMGENYLGYPIAENIMDATGPWQNNYADAADCARDQFMNSQPHRETRLNKSLKYVGFAMYWDGMRLCICEHYSM